MSRNRNLVDYQQELADIIESLPDATLVIDKKGKILFWNREMAKLTGYASEDMVGQGNYEYALAFYGSRRPILVDMIVDPKVKFDQEYVYIKRDGDILTTETTIGKLQGRERVLWGRAAPLHDSGGHLIGAIETIRDITDRKQVEEQLRDSQRQLADIIESLPDATGVVDSEGKIIYWNRAMEDLTGFPSESMVGKGNYEFAIPFYGYRRPVLLNYILDPTTNINQEYSYIHSADNVWYIEARTDKLRGQEAYIWARAAPLYDHDGNVVGAIETVRDVTDRKRAEKELSDSRRQLSDIIESLPDATFVIDRSGIILEWNQEMAKMTGYSAKDMVGKGNCEYSLAFYRGERRPMIVDMIINPDLDLSNKYVKLYREGNVVVTEDNIAYPRGEAKVMWGRAAPLYSSDGEVIGAIQTIRDFTERKKAEEEIKRSHDQLEHVFDGTVHALAVTTEKRDLYTSGHQQRVAALSVMIARDMGLDEHTIHHLNIAASLHDIGKLYIPLDILSQPSRLNDIQRLLVMNHSEAGYDMVKNIPFEGPIAQIIEQHHERIDGSGYPLGLKRDSILLEARILAVADTVEAMAAARPYRPALGVDRALEEIRSNAGKLYDPEVVEVCAKILLENRFEFATNVG